jgi:hypothetical protein
MGPPSEVCQQHGQADDVFDPFADCFAASYCSARNLKGYEMADIRNFDDLFLDQAKVKFTLTNQEPSDDVPHIDLDLEVEGDLRSMATLSYSFRDKSWCGVIRQSQHDDDSFDFDAPATAEQFDNLLRAVPQERMEHIHELQTYFDQNGSFPSKGLRL